MSQIRNRLNPVLVGTLVFLMLIGGLMGWAQLASNADASGTQGGLDFRGAEVVGDPSGATDRILYVDQSSSSVKRVVLFAAGAQTPVSGTTPVASSTYCGFGGRTLFRADAYLSGTMTGTNPTLAVKLQHSIDGGTTWIDVGTWTTINATVTPASQSNSFSDIWNATTPVVYGDCWRATKTYGGTSPGANLNVVLIAK